MCRMYTLFCQKKEGDSAPYPLTKMLYEFLNITKANGVFVSPGHLSQNTSTVDSLLSPLVNTSVTKLGIGNKYGADYIKLYEDYLDSYNRLWRVARNGKSDHRKMVFIFEYDSYLDDIDCYNYEDIVDEINVIGVFIGSSNFSYASYGDLFYGGTCARKGEADILMFYNERFKDYMREILTNASRDSFVLSESLADVSKDFLKEMFLETLKHTLR